MVMLFVKSSIIIFSIERKTLQNQRQNDTQQAQAHQGRFQNFQKTKRQLRGWEDPCQVDFEFFTGLNCKKMGQG